MNDLEEDLLIDKVIYEFPVLWEGWECDSVAWIMERIDRTRYLIMTNHGSNYEAKHQELLDRIQEYESVIDKTRTALNLLMSCHEESK